MSNTILLRIEADHFVAGIDIVEGKGHIAAPIIRYMRGWSLDKIQDYCKKKGWSVEQVEGYE